MKRPPFLTQFQIDEIEERQRRKYRRLALFFFSLSILCATFGTYSCITR